MLRQLDTFQALSEQDYGPWLDRVTLYENEEDGKLYLQEEYGYSKPYDRNWYELAGKPAGSLSELLGGCEGFCGAGKDQWEVNLGVAVSPTSRVRNGRVE